MQKPTSPSRNQNDHERKSVLHVGCGPARLEHMPALFHHGWREVRLDIDPAASPDILGTITDMHEVADGSMDALYSSHNLEHVYTHEVPIALREFHRVLKPGGLLLITLPDLQAVAEEVAAGKLEDTLYESPAGPIAAIDMLYGHRPQLAQGQEYMAHKTGFTAATLGDKIKAAGFDLDNVNREGFALFAVARKSTNGDR